MEHLDLITKKPNWKEKCFLFKNQLEMWKGRYFHTRSVADDAVNRNLKLIEENKKLQALVDEMGWMEVRNDPAHGNFMLTYSVNKNLLDTTKDKESFLKYIMEMNIEQFRRILIKARG